jgi:hypothetical protein
MCSEQAGLNLVFERVSERVRDRWEGESLLGKVELLHNGGSRGVARAQAPHDQHTHSLIVVATLLLALLEEIEELFPRVSGQGHSHKSVPSRLTHNHSKEDL